MEKENVVDDVEKDVQENNSGAEKDTQTSNAEDEKTAVDTGKQEESFPHTRGDPLLKGIGVVIGSVAALITAIRLPKSKKKKE